MGICRRLDVVLGKVGLLWSVKHSRNTMGMWMRKKMRYRMSFLRDVIGAIVPRPCVYPKLCLFLGVAGTNYLHGGIQEKVEMDRPANDRE